MEQLLPDHHTDAGWRRGLPPGPADVERFEVYFSPAGATWWREKPRATSEQPAQ